jgi:Zinc-finger double-stranded RNA-binding/Zinc-finger of C2H2 type
VSTTSTLDITALETQLSRVLREEVSPVAETTPTVTEKASSSSGPGQYRIPKKKSTLKIRQKQAVALELKKLRQERRQARKPKSTFSCKICKLACNSRISFREHVQSRRHKHTKSLKLGRPKCGHCDREFESETHFERHLRGKDHLKVVTALSRKL